MCACVHTLHCRLYSCICVYREPQFPLTHPSPGSTRQLILPFFLSPFATPSPRGKVWVPYHWYMQLSASLCKGSPVSAAPGTPCPLFFVGSAPTQGCLCADALLTQLGPVLPGRHASTWARTTLLCRAPSAPAGPTLACGTWLSRRCPPPALLGASTLGFGELAQR